MAIDAMIDRFRATGCGYAIDGKQGGRILSPLQDRSRVSWWQLLTLQPSQNTFERRNGLLSYADSVITSANGVFSAVNPATASLLTLPLQLGGYTGSLTMLWKGNVQEDAFG